MTLPFGRSIFFSSGSSLVYVQPIGEFGRGFLGRNFLGLTCTSSSPEELHPSCDDLGPPAARSVALPLARAQSAFDKHLPAFLEMFVANERELPESHNSVPFNMLLSFAFFIE